MEDQGYAYAGWARGVAVGNTTSGIAATEFLKGTALMGMGGKEPINLSEAEISQIKTDMAQAYLDTLRNIASQPGNDGNVNRDVNASEVYGFHDQVFTKNGLDIENWTLYAPFKIIEKIDGKDAVEKYWQDMRKTGGKDSYDGLINNLATLAS